MAEPIDEETSRSDLVHERLRESPVERWVLLDGNRYVLTALVSVGVFATCLAIGLAGYVPVTDSATATTLVAAIVGGTLPFITIVLAINQLVLSQELGWTGDLQDRFEAMTEFRREVEELTGTPVSPAAPADFLQLLVDTAVERAETLGSLADGIDDSTANGPTANGPTAADSTATDSTTTDSAVTDPTAAERVEDLVEAVTHEGRTVTDALEDANFGTFDALSSVLGRFNGAHLYAARTIRANHDDDLPDEALETLDALIELLGHLAVARQTFKTLYTQYELSHLSKLLLYVGFPTLLGGGIFMMTYGPIIEAVGDPTALVVVVSTVVTFVFLPFVVLLVYTLRIATIASRTADFGPFVPRVDFGEE